jgi:hypothetical protein
VRHLRASTKARMTVVASISAVDSLGAVLADQGMPTDPVSITREHVEALMADILSRAKPATARNRYRALGTYVRWLTDEGGSADSPMRRMKPPHVPEEPPEVLSDDQLTKLLKACGGATSGDRRDTALIVLLLDTGMRRAELTGMKKDGGHRRRSRRRSCHRQGTSTACPPAREQDGGSARPVPARRSETSTSEPAQLLERPAGSDGRQRTFGNVGDDVMLNLISPRLNAGLPWSKGKVAVPAKTADPTNQIQTCKVAGSTVGSAMT